MKKPRLRKGIFLFFALFCLGFIPAGWLFGQAGGTEPGVTVMTFNIRYNNQGDLQNAWPNRKSLVASTLRLSKTGHYGATQSFNGFNIELDPGKIPLILFLSAMSKVSSATASSPRFGTASSPRTTIR